MFHFKKSLLLSLWALTLSSHIFASDSSSSFKPWNDRSSSSSDSTSAQQAPPSSQSIPKDKTHMSFAMKVDTIQITSEAFQHKTKSEAEEQGKLQAAASNAAADAFRAHNAATLQEQLADAAIKAQVQARAQIELKEHLRNNDNASVDARIAQALNDARVQRAHQDGLRPSLLKRTGDAAMDNFNVCVQNAVLTATSITTSHYTKKSLTKLDEKLERYLYPEQVQARQRVMNVINDRQEVIQGLQETHQRNEALLNKSKMVEQYLKAIKTINDLSAKKDPKLDTSDPKLSDNDPKQNEKTQEEEELIVLKSMATHMLAMIAQDFNSLHQREIALTGLSTRLTHNSLSPDSQEIFQQILGHSSEREEEQEKAEKEA